MRADHWKSGIVRILAPDGGTAGTGFMISPGGLVVTCAHVVADADPGGTVQLFFHGNPERVTARLVAGCQSAVDDADVAVLRLEGAAPAGAVPLPLGSSERCDGRTFQTYGFPRFSPADGLPGAGEVIGDRPWGARRALSVRSQEITRGFSGAPAWDPQRRWVIGMVNGLIVPDEYARNSQTALLTPSEVLCDVCGELELTRLSDVVLRDWRRWTRSERARVFAPQVDDYPDLVEPPLCAAFSGFVQEQGWHARMEERLRDLHRRAERFPELEPLARDLQSVDCAAVYENVAADVQALLARTPGDAVHALISRLERQAEAPGAEQGRARLDLPHAQAVAARLGSLRRMFDSRDGLRFERCFLVLGSTGAGKTHFISSLLGRNTASGDTRGHPVLLLPLTGFYRTEPLAELILEGAGAASGLRWDELAALDRFLADEADGARLVVILDDLQKWLAARPAFLDELVDTVSSHTHLHSLYWLATLEHTTYPAVAGHGAFWTRYGPRSDTGWVMLDEVNLREHVGIEMLRRVWDSGPDEIAWLGENEAAARYLSIPFVARVAIDLKLKPEELVTLNFVDFVEAFWRTRRQAFDYDALAASGTDRDRAALVVNNAIVSVVQHLADTGDFSPESARLAARVASDEPGLSLDDARAALQVLARANLLRPERHGGTATGGLERIVERMLVHFEMFWEYHVALRLLEAAGQAGEAEAARARLETWFTAVGSRDVEDGVFQFLLLLTDSVPDGNASAEGVRWLMQSALETDRPPGSAVWFAGPRASEALQRDLVGRVPGYALGADLRRTLFALVYFVAEVRPGLLDLRSRLTFLQPYYEAMRDGSLAQYFLFVVRRLFRAAGDHRVIVAALPALSGCEVLGIAPALAELAADALLDTADVGVRDPDEEDTAAEWEAERARALVLLGDLMGYLEACSPGVDAEYARFAPRPGEQRTLFRESLLFYLLRGLVEVYGTDMYALLDEIGWYRPDRGRIHRRIALEMQREANITLGNEYMDMGPDERQRFEALVARLVDGGGRSQREIAFYLIRHTRVTGGRVAVRVAPVFRPLLAAISDDPRLPRLAQRFAEMFKANQP